MTWYWGDILPVVTLRTKGTCEEWHSENPRNMPNRALGFHLGIFLPSCSVGSRTYTGQPNTWARANSFPVFRTEDQICLVWVQCQHWVTCWTPMWNNQWLVARTWDLLVEANVSQDGAYLYEPIVPGSLCFVPPHHSENAHRHHWSCTLYCACDLGCSLA
jgi:hypothetical protein